MSFKIYCHIDIGIPESNAIYMYIYIYTSLYHTKGMLGDENLLMQYVCHGHGNCSYTKIFNGREKVRLYCLDFTYLPWMLRVHILILMMMNHRWPLITGVCQILSVTHVLVSLTLH